MGTEVIERGPEGGSTLLVGRDGDYVNARASGAETGGAYTVYEVTSTPGFGPPLHSHPWHEFFYVLEGRYEFSFVKDGRVTRVEAGPGTSFTIPPGAAHGFRNAIERPSRMLVFDHPVGIERMFLDHGVPVAGPGGEPQREPLDPAKLGELLPRYGLTIETGEVG
jgi:quercetin dioxygenase-like cupin family protein